MLTEHGHAHGYHAWIHAQLQDQVQLRVPNTACQLLPYFSACAFSINMRRSLATWQELHLQLPLLVCVNPEPFTR
jgi:hypothetical protein